MRRLEIEWRHLVKDGNACVRCADTGKALSDVIEELTRECGAKGVEIVFKETTLSGSEIPESNKILFNGVPIEEVLPRTTASTSHCASCCDLTGQETFCRTVEHEEHIFESIPPHLIRDAACRVAQCC